jgi:hypothetical protein
VIIQRKLIWLSDSTSAGSNLGNFDDVLNSYSGSAGSPTNNVHLSWFSQGVAGCNITGNTTYGLATLNYNTWYTLEFQVTLNTPSVSDGAIHLWVNGSNVYTATGLGNLRGACSGNLSLLALGEQANRTDATTVVDEYRYWTNVFINTTGP